MPTAIRPGASAMRPYLWAILLGFAALFLALAPAEAAAAPTNRVPVRGRLSDAPPPMLIAQDLVFTDSAPYSTPAEVARRLGHHTEMPDYDLRREKFRCTVPANTNTPLGLLVWVSPGDDAYLPPDWPAQLQRQRLLLVSAYKAGNERHPVDRIRLALDGLFNMSRRFNIDPKRLYVAGFSGGGRIASMIVVGYSDLLSGAFCVCGVNFYCALPMPGNRFYPASFIPDSALAQRAKTAVRIVLLTGQFDPNHDNTRAAYERGFRAVGYKHLLYVDVPGMRHQIPGADQLRKSIEFLDAK